MNYKVVFNPNIECDGIFETEYETHKEAEMAMNAIANYTLFLHECSHMPDYSNIGYVLKLDNGEWIEIDGDGQEL